MRNFFHKAADKQAKETRWIFGIMLVAGLMALTAAFVLSVEKIELLQHPNQSLACDFNIVFNCSNVMQTWQSRVFGFPNMYIGLMAYSVIVTVSVLGLMGVVFPRRFLIAANIGFALGALFAYWLLFQSIYVIQILCPWCLVVTVTTTLILSSMTHYTMRRNVFGFKKHVNKKIQAFYDKGYHQLVVASWIVLIVALIVIKFGNALFA
jgi:uncharacterized membrane protein